MPCLCIMTPGRDHLGPVSGAHSCPGTEVSEMVLLVSSLPLTLGARPPAQQWAGGCLWLAFIGEH